MNIAINSKKSDLLGVMASGLCAVHCAITPFFFAARPLMDTAVCTSQGCCSDAPFAWAMLDYLFLVISLVAVWYSAKQTNNNWVKLLLWGGWAFFGIGLMLEAGSFTFGKWVMYSGSAALVATHVVNYIYCPTCEEKGCCTV